MVSKIKLQPKTRIVHWNIKWVRAPHVLLTAARTDELKRWREANPWADNIECVQWACEGLGTRVITGAIDATIPCIVRNLSAVDLETWPAHAHLHVPEGGSGLAAVLESARQLALARLSGKRVLEVCADASGGLLAFGAAAGGAFVHALAVGGPPPWATAAMQAAGVDLDVGNPRA